MTDYAQQQWQQAAPVKATARRKRGTTLSRWSVLLGIESILFGLILPVPVFAIVFGIVGLARGTDVPGRAAAGIVLGWSCLTFWGGFIALCVWWWATSRI